LTGNGALHTLPASTRRGNRHRIGSWQAASADTVALLTVSGLCKTFHGFAAVSNVSFEVGEGEILGLIGPNGSGKSTIFNCIAGMYRPTAGSITFAGAEIAGLPADRVCHRGIGRTYQIPRPFRNLTLLENVALSAWFGQHGNTDRASCWRQAEEALRLVGLPSDAAADTLGLGAAALKKLELARALATQPRLLLADESLNGLDHGEMEQAADMLQRIRRDRKITIVWVEHIMGVLMRVVDRVVVLDHGEKIFDGAPDAAQSDARVVEVYLGAEAVA
jgi:branched-chain amino acid transport system ATP-binding protein